MATYRNLLAEKDFLKVQLRARVVSKSGVILRAIYYKNRELMFLTHSVTDPKLVYTERIELSDLDIDAILNAKKFRDIENLIKNGNIKIYCSCPAFHYWGYQYMAWKRGYGLVKETRRPKIRNPYEKGYLCKHLYAIMLVFPLLARPVANKFKYWATKKVEWEGEAKTSKFFGTRKVTTDLSKNEGVSLRDSYIDDEPLITADDIINDNVETVQPFGEEPIVDTTDISTQELPDEVSDYLPEGVQDSGEGFSIDEG